VDTSVIVNLLEHFTEVELKKGKFIVNRKRVIKNTLEKLAGTFALSMVFCDTNEVFIARSGSVLHYNNKGDYSTTGGMGFKELPEGTIMKLNNEIKLVILISILNFYSYEHNDIFRNSG
jgi:3'-phosphoadenosine 5'-phosphosulfate sulfotransferase